MYYYLFLIKLSFGSFTPTCTLKSKYMTSITICRNTSLSASVFFLVMNKILILTITKTYKIHDNILLSNFSETTYVYCFEKRFLAVTSLRDVFIISFNNSLKRKCWRILSRSMYLSSERDGFHCSSEKAEKFM